MNDIVATFIVLYNMCIIGKEKFNMKWIEQTRRKLKRWIENRSLREKNEG